MKSSTLLIIAFVLAVVTVISLSVGIVLARGSYNLSHTNVKTNPEVSEFRKIDFEGIGQLYITQGEKDSLEIEAPEKVLSQIKTKVVDGTLFISYEERKPWYINFDFIGDKQITYRVTVKDLTKFEGKGLGETTIKNITADKFDFISKGAGEISIENITVGTLKMDIQGLGDVTTSGTVDSLEVAFEGSGNFDGKDLQSKNGKVTMKGLGNVSVYATENLDISFEGMGNLTYYGDAKTSISQDGLGKVTHGRK